MVCYSDGFEYVVSFLDFKPDSGKVLDWHHFAFISEPIPCPRDWGCCSFEDLSIDVVPGISSVTDRDGVLHSWFNGKWTSDCREFRGEGKVCVKSM